MRRGGEARARAKAEERWRADLLHLALLYALMKRRRPMPAQCLLAAALLLVPLVVSYVEFDRRLTKMARIAMGERVVRRIIRAVEHRVQRAVQSPPFLLILGRSRLPRRQPRRFDGVVGGGVWHFVLLIGKHCEHD